MQKKLSLSELLEMGAGEVKTVVLPTEKARHSAMVLAYNAIQYHPREDVERYSCRRIKIDGIGFPLKITAVRNVGERD